VTRQRQLPVRAEQQSRVAGCPGGFDGFLADRDRLGEPAELDERMQREGQQDRDEVAVSGAMADRHLATQLAEGLLVAVEVAQGPREVAEELRVWADLAVICIGDERERTVERRARLVGAAGGGEPEREHRERAVFEEGVFEAAGVGERLARDGRDALESQVVELHAGQRHSQREARQ